MFETDCLGRLIMDKKYLEITGCTYCDNSKHLMGFDYYIWKDENVCKEKNCKYYQNFKKMIKEEEKKALDDLLEGIGLKGVANLPERVTT